MKSRKDIKKSIEIAFDDMLKAERDAQIKRELFLADVADWILGD